MQGMTQQAGCYEDIPVDIDDDDFEDDSLAQRGIHSSRVMATKHMNGSSEVLNRDYGSKSSHQESMTDYTNNCNNQMQMHVVTHSNMQQLQPEQTKIEYAQEPPKHGSFNYPPVTTFG